MFSSIVRNFTDLRTKSITFGHSRVSCLQPTVQWFERFLHFYKQFRNTWEQKAERKLTLSSRPSCEWYTLSPSPSLSLPPSLSLSLSSTFDKLIRWLVNRWLIDEVRGKSDVRITCTTIPLLTEAKEHVWKKQHKKTKLLIIKFFPAHFESNSLSNRVAWLIMVILFLF